VEAVKQFYEWVPPWIRHSATTLLSLSTLALGLMCAVIWFFGMLPAWFGVVIFGYQPQLTDDMAGIPASIAIAAGSLYIFVSWIFYVAGAALIPVGWGFQLAAMKWPAMHWFSRLASVLALLSFIFPLGILGVQMFCVWLVA
jgi:hypothetical protein